MRAFLKHRFFDWLLCVCMATAISFNIFSGFELSDRLSQSIPMVAAFMAVAMFILIMLSRSKKTILGGVIAGIVLLVILLVYLRTGDAISQGTIEQNNSLAIALAVTVSVAVLVYLACRTMAGVITLLVVGNLIICGSRFLQFPVRPWSFLLFLFAGLLMLWYRNYINTLHQASVGKVRITRFMMQSLLICVVALALGGTAYYGIVKPIDPPTRELKLIDVLKQNKIVKMTGLYSPLEMMDPTLVAADDQIEEGGQDETQENGDQTAGGFFGGRKQQNQQNEQQPQETTQKVWYDLNYILLPWHWILLAAVITAIFLGRYFYWRKWKKTVDGLTSQNRVLNYYGYFLTSLKRIGYKKSDGHTLSEYAENIAHDLEEVKAGEASFPALTEIYSRVIYGHEAITNEEAGLFEVFYKGFRKAIRKEVGIWKYCLNFFRL